MNRKPELSMMIVGFLVCLMSCSDGEMVDHKEQRFESFSGAYFGLTAPSSAPEVFLPTLVSTEEDERCVTFLDSGKVCLFTTDHGGTSYTWLKDGRWTPAEPFPFNYRDDMLDYTAGPDGRTLVFMTSRPIDENDPGTTHHLWTVEWTGAGWGEPKPLPAPEKIEGLGSGYPTLSADGTLYFISDARNGAEDGGIYRCRLEDGPDHKVELVEYPINTPYIDFDPYIAPDESYLVFSSNRPGGFGLWDSYVAFMKDDGSWTPAFNLGKGFNTEYSEACPNVTPGGGLFFFAGARTTDFLVDESTGPVPTGRDVYWVSTSVIESLRAHHLETGVSAERVREVLEKRGLEPAIETLEVLYADYRSEFSFQPEDLLEICAELISVGDAAGADDFYEALVRIFPEKGRIMLGYATICALHGRLGSSATIVGELQTEIRDFNLEYAVLHMGIHLSRASRTDDEIALYEMFLDLLPDSYRLHYYLAAAYEEQGSSSNALGSCKRAFELNPNHPYITEMLKRLDPQIGN